MPPHRCSVACSPFHPNHIWNWGPDDIHHHSLPRSTHSLPRSKTPAAPVGSILMKPLPGAGDNPHLQIWSVFFDAEPVLSHSAHFLSIFPDLTWFIKWVFGHTPVLLLVSPPLILKHFFLSSDAKFISRAHWQKCWKVPTLGALPTEPQWVPPWSDDSPLMTPFWCCQTASP